MSQQFTASRESEPDLKPAAWRAHRVSRSSKATSRLEKHVKAAVRNSYRSVRGDSPLEGFEQHYLNYRNRSHFGHVRSSLMGNELAVHLLSNPWLLRAAQLTPIDSRAAGGVVSEIFQRTVPTLLDLPFESDIWTTRLSRAHPSIGSESWQASFDESRKPVRRDSFLAGHEHGSRNKDWEFSAKDETARTIDRNFRLLEESAPAELSEPLIEQHHEISEHIESGNHPSGKALAASTSALDAIIPRNYSNFCVELGGNPPQSQWSANAARIGRRNKH